MAKAPAAPPSTSGTRQAEHQPAGDRRRDQVHDGLAHVAALDPGASGKLTASNYSGTLSATLRQHRHRDRLRRAATSSPSRASRPAARSCRSGQQGHGQRAGHGAQRSPTSTREVHADRVERPRHALHGRQGLLGVLDPAAVQQPHAQLVNASTGKVVTTRRDAHLRVGGRPDGLDQHDRSAGKTELLDLGASTIYGAAPAPNVGLTGNATPSLTAEADGARCAPTAGSRRPGCRSRRTTTPATRTSTRWSR